MATTIITETITAHVDTITKIYETAYRNAFASVERWEKQHPGRSAYNDMFMCHEARMAGQVSRHESCMPSSPKHLDEALVTKYARANAESLVAEYAFKVERKAAGMIDVAVSAMDASGAFTVTGRKADRAILITQSVVWKTSSRGKTFAQFPALVYIDGRKSTEKALLALA